MKGYFELGDDLEVKGRWHLNGLHDARGVRLDSRFFRSGAWIELRPTINAPRWSDGTMVEVTMPLTTTSRSDGNPLDFTYADFAMPVVKRRASEILETIAHHDIQRIPVTVADRTDHFDIVNVATLVDCIDTQRSNIEWWEQGNNIRPDLTGTPKLIAKLVVDPNRTQGRHILRPLGAVWRIIVSDVVKQAFEDACVTGVTFQNVS